MRWRNPSGDPDRKRKGSVLGANALAFEAMSLLPCFAAGSRLATTGFRVYDRRPFLCWSLWQMPYGTDTVRSILARPVRRPEGEGRLVWPASGDGPRYVAERVSNGDYSNLTVGRPA